MKAAPPDPLRVVDASFAAAAGVGGELLPPTLPEIAFAGRSNVGKSSLMNSLMGRRNLVRTSGTPGCTRTVNLFHVRCADAAEMYLVDLPGYGYAKRSKGERSSWGPMLERYLGERASLRALVVLVDARRGMEPEEDELLEFVEAAKAARSKVPTLVVAIKIDKLPAAQRKPAVAKLARPGIPVLGVSAETGEGRDALWRRLRKLVGVGMTEAPAAEATREAEQG